MFDLPTHLQQYIWSFDETPRVNYAITMLQLELIFYRRGKRRGYKRVLRELAAESWLWHCPTQAETYYVLWRRKEARGGYKYN
tara:strand:- start:198 stop:446 length:249 start_codon:yes stop_codon:yes gene_type:complete